jgi:microcystin-dependent protein
LAETLTPNYGWKQPAVGGDASVWGTTLNNDLALIDAQVFSNEQATVMIGCITMYGGAVAPANWLLCDGSSLSTTGTYAKLFGIIGYAFGGSGANFNLPNLQANFPIGAGAGVTLGQVGGASSVALSVAQLPPHAHPITDVAHNHSVNQSSHAHAIATGSHAHGIVTGSHAHSGVVTGTVPTGGAIQGGVGGNLAFGNTSTVGNIGGNTDTAGNLGGNTDTQTTAVSLNASGTGLSTTQNTGSGSAVPTTPPYVSVSFIIRYQ